MLKNYQDSHFKLIACIGFVVLFFSNNLLADSTCYTEEKYPNITSIRKGDKGLEFIAGGINLDKKNNSAPVITLINDSSWDSRTWAITDTKKCKSYNCLEETANCKLDLPKIKLTVHEAMKLRSFKYIPESIDQSISACVTHGDDIYFGIAFYAGEGVSGVGGIGRYNIKNKVLDVRRPSILTDSSVTHLAYDGKLLWIATAHHYECSGTPPAVGLIRYDWDKNIVQDFNDIGAGFCGFVIHDIHITETSAWVASDLGLSQTYRTKDDYNYGWENGWRHYIPQTDKQEVMKKVWCNELYTDLLNNLPRNDHNLNTNSYEQLFNNLARFKPSVLKKYVDSLRLKKKSTNE